MMKAKKWLVALFSPLDNNLAQELMITYLIGLMAATNILASF